MRTSRRTFLATLAATCLSGPSRAGPATRDTALVDPATQRRIRLRLRFPESEAPAPLVLYSPGLGSGTSNGAAWCEAWRKAGCVVVTMAHPGTDDGIWDTRRRSFAGNLERALAGGQYAARVRDTKFVIRQCLENAALGMAGRIDAARIGVAGHSYGAITVQALAVEAAGGGAAAGHIKALIALSPGVLTAANARTMNSVRLPFFCVTGDHDNFVTFSQDGTSRRLGVPLANRLAVYRALPAGHKQLLVLAGADHMTFAGEAVDGRRFSRDVAAGAAESAAAWARVSAATAAFWTYALGQPDEAAARARFAADVRTVLRPQDRFETA